MFARAITDSNNFKSISLHNSIPVEKKREVHKFKMIYAACKTSKICGTTKVCKAKGSVGINLPENKTTFKASLPAFQLNFLMLKNFHFKFPPVTLYESIVIYSLYCAFTAPEHKVRLHRKMFWVEGKYKKKLKFI